MTSVIVVTFPGPPRDGFDPAFLGVPTPLPSLPGVPTVVLDYTHFSTLHRPDRRLAAATAVGIDGAAIVDVERADDWRLDPRLPAAQQAGPEIYRDNDLDRGHLVRRRDPVRGPVDVARCADEDTFHYTNAAPQASDFNQGAELWWGSRTTCWPTPRTSTASSWCSPARSSPRTTRSTAGSGSRCATGRSARSWSTARSAPPVTCWTRPRSSATSACRRPGRRRRSGRTGRSRCRWRTSARSPASSWARCGAR